MDTISHKITDIQMKLDSVMANQQDGKSMRQAIYDAIENVFESEEKYSTINRLHDKLNSLLNDEKRKKAVELATATLDKFEDYMKNVDKLNALVNEFKGCVSMARGSMQNKKQQK